MKQMKTLFLCAWAALTAGGLNAQTLLDENFESLSATQESDQFPEGWTTINTYSGDNLSYRWSVTYNSKGVNTGGNRAAECDAPTYGSGTVADGFGPREEKLLTPELDLNDTYQLSFDWYSNGASVFDTKSYTFQVRVIDTATSEETTIWDYSVEDQVRDSGVPVSQYNGYRGWLWDAWTVYNSKLDLSAFQGKKVKVAFVYVLKKATANVLMFDNVKVVQAAPVNQPVAEVSNTEYEFAPMFIGEKFYSEAFTLKNVGAKGLKITGFDAPAGVELWADVDNIDLGVNETAKFQISYTASLLSPTSFDAVLKTNGGDVTIHVTATKQVIPEGCNLEGFEGNQFPPAGWSNNGWSRYGYGLEGDACVYASGSLEDIHLVTPRLDLSGADAPRTLQFTYFSDFSNGEAGEVPYNDFMVEVSTDSCKTWVTAWTADYTLTDQMLTVTVDLSEYATDNVTLRFTNTAVTYNDGDVDPYSYIFLDRVLLPTFYGQDGVPAAIEMLSPANGATDVYPKNVLLKWKEAQFAEGYKLYVGKSSDNFDVINGEEVTATEYTLPVADYATTYYWKAIPFNAVGEAPDTLVWSFTTQPDLSVKSFPWNEGFENGVPPLGWFVDSDGTTVWSSNDTQPYDGKHSASANIRGKVGYASLCTPDVTLPAGSEYRISFVWGNGMCVGLTRDPNAVHTNEHNTEYNGNDAGYFEIFADGEWKQLTMLSDPSDDQYWIYESFDLTPYAGKTVAFRWRYVATSYMKSKGLSLDNVTIDTNAASVKLNTESWNAYKVNHNTARTSDTMAATNLGGAAVTVESVAFTSANFTTTLQPGTVVAPSSSAQFTVTFNALDAASSEAVTIKDVMTVAFSDGSQAQIDLTGIALPADVLYYGFEDDETGKAPAGFSVIDADGLSTAPIYFWTTPNIGAPMSFFVLNDSECYSSLKEPNGHQSLMTRCNTNGTANDFLVTQLTTINANSSIEFDCRAWESVNSILPADAPTFNVLVSETSATDKNAFTLVDGAKPDLFDNVAWNHYEYSLAAYAGKKVYVAIQAVYENSLGGFLDNVQLNHVGDNSGVSVVAADDCDNTVVYDLNGIKVAEGRNALRNVEKGLYIVKTGNTATKVVK